MKNILISATQPQRFKAQLSFAQKVATETEQFNFYFFVSDEVYFLYNDIIDQLNLRVVNQPKKNTTIKITGIDKELVGKVASEIKMLKPVEPYKAKGIKERGQYVLRKEGKKK